MRKNKALYMWSAVTAVAIAAAVFDYQWDKRTQEQKSIADRVLKLEASQVREIELILENPASVTKDSIPLMTNKILLSKSEQGWRIKSPVEELADQSAVEGYVEWLAHERVSQVAAKEPIDWEGFGLETPKGSIQIKDEQGRAFKINVSNRKNFEGDAFLRRNDEEKVFLGNAMWFSNIEKTLIEFRDKRILRIPVAEIKRFQLKLAKVTLPFERKDSVWILATKPMWKLDQNRVRELIATLTGPLVVEFKREGAIRPADLNEYALEKSRSSIEVEVAEGMTWTAELSEHKDQNVFVRVSDPSMVVAISGGDGDKLSQVTADDFRDRKAPFELSRDKLKSIEMTKAGLGLRAEKEQNNWQVREKTEGTKVDGTQISGLIERLRNLEVAEYVPGVKDVGADATSIVMKDNTGTTQFSLSFGRLETIKRAGGGERAVVLAKSSLADEIISIDKDQFDALQLANLLGEKPAPPDVKK